MSSIYIAYTTFKNIDEARHVCQKLVQEKLIACANINQPHFSIYQWEGHLEASEEVSAILKFSKNNLEKVKSAFVEYHSYENPCFVAWKAKNTTDEFKQWILSNQ